MINYITSDPIFYVFSSVRISRLHSASPLSRAHTHIRSVNYLKHFLILTMTAILISIVNEVSAAC